MKLFAVKKICCKKRSICTKLFLPTQYLGKICHITATNLSETDFNENDKWKNYRTNRINEWNFGSIHIHFDTSSQQRIQHAILSRHFQDMPQPHTNRENNRIEKQRQ